MQVFCHEGSRRTEHRSTSQQPACLFRCPRFPFAHKLQTVRMASGCLLRQIEPSREQYPQSRHVGLLTLPMPRHRRALGPLPVSARKLSIGKVDRSRVYHSRWYFMLEMPAISCQHHHSARCCFLMAIRRASVRAAAVPRRACRRRGSSMSLGVSRRHVAGLLFMVVPTSVQGF